MLSMRLIGVEPTSLPQNTTENKGVSKVLYPKSVPCRQSEPVMDSHNLPADLAAVVDAWDNLPEPIKAGILAMVKASK